MIGAADSVLPLEHARRERPAHRRSAVDLSRRSCCSAAAYGLPPPPPSPCVRSAGAATCRRPRCSDEASRHGSDAPAPAYAGGAAARRRRLAVLAIGFADDRRIAVDLRRRRGRRVHLPARWSPRPSWRSRGARPRLALDRAPPRARQHPPARCADPVGGPLARARPDPARHADRRSTATSAASSTRPSPRRRRASTSSTSSDATSPAFMTCPQGRRRKPRSSQVPMLRGRIVRRRDSADGRAGRRPTQWVLDGDRGITYAAAAPDEHKLVAGKLVAPTMPGRRWCRSTATSPRGWASKLGDTVAVNVLGREIDGDDRQFPRGRVAVARLQFRAWSFAQRLQRRAAFAPRHARPARRRHARSARRTSSRAVSIAYPAISRAARQGGDRPGRTACSARSLGDLRGHRRHAGRRQRWSWPGRLPPASHRRLYERSMLKTLGATRAPAGRGVRRSSTCSLGPPPQFSRSRRRRPPPGSTSNRCGSDFAFLPGSAFWRRVGIAVRHAPDRAGRNLAGARRESRAGLAQPLVRVRRTLRPP